MAELAYAWKVPTDRPRALDGLCPPSFAERGVAVGFTTPALAVARLRHSGREQCEIVMPNLVDGRGVYVVPWAALSEVMSPTIHDRALYREIVNGERLDPEGARLAQLRVAARGFAGIDVAAAAARALETDDRLATALNVALMMQAIHEGGLTSAEAIEAAGSGSADSQFKRAFDNLAGRLDMTAVALADRVARLSAALAPIGLAAPQPTGRLRRLVARLDDFRAALADWAASEPGDYGDIAKLCSAVAAHAAEGGQAVLNAIDERFVSLIPSLRAWPRDSRLLAEARARLAWLLDGWKGPIATWIELRDAARPVQRAALGTILPGLSLPPQDDERAEAAIELARAHRRLMRRHCRLFDDGDSRRAAAAAIRRMELGNLRAEYL